MAEDLVILAGATGDLGGRIAEALAERQTPTRALVRDSADASKLTRLKKLGIEVKKVNFDNPAAIKRACAGGSCLVSALSGLRPVIVGLQGKLLRGAIEAGVPRFVPSDFSLEIPNLPAGLNRNLDLRRDFHAALADAPIRATSIYNGAFAELLLGQAPLVLPRLRRVLYWEDADQPMAFTTKNDTAHFTARVATDPKAPRSLRVAGFQLSARELCDTATNVYGKKFHLFRVGSAAGLERTIKITRALLAESDAVYPPWQGMQYLHNMFSGHDEMRRLDNDRYGAYAWQSAAQVLGSRVREKRA